MLEDGRVLGVANVIWCTGSCPTSRGSTCRSSTATEPVHDAGSCAGEPGLYFLGLPFLYGITSFLIGGVGRDAEHIAEHIALRDSGGQSAAGRARDLDDKEMAA